MKRLKNGWIFTSVILIIAIHLVSSDESDECGTQSIDELPDMHASAPWAAALFLLDGDPFQNKLHLRYLDTVIFISKTIAIASGSEILAQQTQELQTKLQVFYGHRGSGKQSLNRVRKVEPLIPQKQPLGFRIDVHRNKNQGLRQSSRPNSNLGQSPKPTANPNSPADLYLLHLEAPIDVTAFSRPLCISKDIFRNILQYYGIAGSTRKVHLSGYAARNDTGSQTPHVVYFSGDKDWRVHSWDHDYIQLIMRDKRVTFDFLPRQFNPGSAITVKENGRFYLAGILLRSNNARTIVRSVEKYVDLIASKASITPKEISSASAAAQQPKVTSQTTSTTTASVVEIIGSEIKPEKIEQFPGTFGDSSLAQLTYFEELEKEEAPPTPDRDPHPPTSRAPSCSHETHGGVDIECLTKGVSRENCIKNAPPSTKIRLSCKPHYVPIDGNKVLEKTCDSSGNWLPRRAFACKLDCGNIYRPVPYIVQGSKTQSEKWPWHAALFRKVNETSYAYICGATLITRSILITAAHCVYNSYDNTDISDQYKVVVGAISSDLTTNSRDYQAQEFTIQAIKINEYYNHRNFEGDIALIQLDKPVLLTEYVRPVCFPFPTEENKFIAAKQLVERNLGIVVGFGNTEAWRISETLRMAALPVVSASECLKVLDRQPSSTQYCAGYTNGTSVCEGDSGGAHIFKDPSSKRFFIQGVISHGNRKESAYGDVRCDHEKYTVFTRVFSFTEWVQEVVDDLEYDYNSRRR